MPLTKTVVMQCNEASLLKKENPWWTHPSKLLGLTQVFGVKRV